MGETTMSLELWDTVVEREVDVVNVNYTKDSRVMRDENIKRNNFFHKKNPKSVEYYKNLSKNEESGTLSEQLSVRNNVKENTPTKPKKEKLSKQMSQASLMYLSLAKKYRRNSIFLSNDKNYEQIKVYKHYNVEIQNVKNKPIKLSVNACIGNWEDFWELMKKDSKDFTGLSEAFQTWLNKAIQDYDVEQKVQETFDSLVNSSQITPNMKKYLYALEHKLQSALSKPSRQPNGFEEKSLEIFNLWLYEAQEVNHIQEIESELNFSSYEDGFPLARSLNRKFSIYVGPTNSGKTHAALNDLAQGSNGLYLAPLRLMASEGQESLEARGITANLVTGEEQQMLPFATHTSSTVEMCNFENVVDACVIDEIQMISDMSRGWAWSQAVIGVPARHVILVGSDESLPVLIPLLEQLGEPYEIKKFERKTPLVVREPIWKVGDLKAGDCVVVFSRKNALEMKANVEATGKKCSVIYGNLSPEVRRSEAAKFKSGENPVLVATDAIGMGLNLPIQRIFFSTLEKFDGENTRALKITEIKQIGGRAGRYGLASSGEVGLLADGSMGSKDLLTKAIYQGHQPIADTCVPIAPNLKQVEKICNILGKNSLFTALLFFKEKLVRQHEVYKTANLESMIQLATILKSKKMSLERSFTYACVPLDPDIESQFILYNRWINNHLREVPNLAPELPEEMEIGLGKITSMSLYVVENYVKICMAYRWLHYKYPEFYPGLEEATENAKKANDYIEKALARHISMTKMLKGRGKK